MSWFLLILGIAIWWGAHLFKRIAPDARASLGDPGKGLVAVAIAVAIVLMVIGYRGADRHLSGEISATETQLLFPR